MNESSPLNVVCAGLEILRDELLQQGAQSIAHLAEGTKGHGMLELVEDIFSASNAAVNILNDLLNYEHIDAGSFCLFVCVRRSHAESILTLSH